jgi:nicotinate-nucleotide adenylyltransferase
LRLAIFGGTFDPIHNGHLTIAREAARQCALTRVLFVPAAVPPHKASGTHAPYPDRLRMVELACTVDARFEASALEASVETNYSIDTIERLQPTLASGDQLYFLIGADAFAEIETWRRWRDVVKAVRFIVVSRPGRQYAVPPGARVERLDYLEVPTSSSEIRRRLERGDGAVDLPPAVLAYIRERKLYGMIRTPG